MAQGAPAEILRSGELEVRPSEFLVFARGRILRLTTREQQMLAVMMRSEGRILGREELYALVWGKKLKPGDRSVDAYVRRLRSRLGEALPDTTFIHTHFGFGYRYSPEPATKSTPQSRLVNNFPDR
jgi:DNA-binding response OmpR family regulator